MLSYLFFGIHINIYNIIKLIDKALADKKVPHKRKKRYLSQKGGGLLTSVLPPVLNVLGNLLV